MTAIFRGQGADKRRPPARHEAMLGIERTQATEAGVHQPEFMVARIRQFVNVDVAGDMDTSGR